MADETPAPKFYESGYEKYVPRARRVRVFEYLFATAVTLVAALGLRWAVVDFFFIRTPAMQQTLLPGDFVAIGKLGFGVRTGARPPVLAWSVPAAGRLYTLAAPEGGLTVKRCAALAGQTVEISGKKAYVDGEEFFFPVTREDRSAAVYPAAYSPRDSSVPYRLPRPGEVLKLDSMELRDQEFCRSIIQQENPGRPLLQETVTRLNGKDTAGFVPHNYAFSRTDRQPDYNAMDWLELQNIVNFVKAQDSTARLEFKRRFRLDGQPVREYQVKAGLAYYLGDNWDQSTDSRYYGPVDKSRLRGRPLFVLFSVEPPDSGKNWWRRVRWKRILKWI